VTFRCNGGPHYVMLSVVGIIKQEFWDVWA